MGDHEIVISGIHPFGKRIGNSLWQWTGMRSPSHDDFRACGLFVFFNGNQIGKTLQRMPRSCFHREYRTSGILNKLIEDGLLIVKLTIFETGKGAYSDDIAITAHHGNGFQQVLRFVTVHDDATFCFQLPGALVDV